MRTLHVSDEDVKAFYETVLKLESEEDCRAFFDDLCTANELKQFAQRIKAARLLMQDKTYQQVIAETDISSCTLARVSRCVQEGEGYRRFLEP